MDPLQPWLDAKEVRRLAEGLLAPPPEVEEAAVDAAYGEVFEGFAGGDDTPTLAKPSETVVVASSYKQEVPPAPEDKAEDKAADDGSADDALSQQADTSSMSSSPVLSRILRSRRKLQSRQLLKLILRFTYQLIKITARQTSWQPRLKARKIRPLRLQPSEVPVSSSDTVKESSPSPVDNDEPIRKLDARGPFLSRIRQFSQVIREDLGAKAMFLIDVNGQILLDEVENAKLIQVARTLANASQRANRQSAGAAAVGNLHVKIGANSTLEVIPVDSRYGLLILGVIFPGPIGAVRVMQVADELHRTIESRR